MILTMLPVGMTCRIQSVRGKDDVRQRLGGLGFVAGAPVTLIAENGGDLIVGVKGARLALGKQLALKIVLEGAPSPAETGEARRPAHADVPSPTLVADC